MLFIEDQRIFLTKGDSAVLEVALENSEGEPYEMTGSDALKLTVRRIPDTGPALLSVSSAPGSNRLALSPADTKDLAAGGYSCDIELTAADGGVYTVFPKYEGISRAYPVNTKNFNIMPEVGA